jgi:diguanylate cyclase (GGDEF)-like protein
MKEFRIVLKLILPLMIGLFFIAIISIYSNYYFIKQNISKNSQDTFLDFTATHDYIIDKEIKLMEGLIDQLKRDQHSIELYKKDNKEWLFMYLHQTYMKFHKNYKLTHFYIHKPNKINYLRVHNRDKNSDLINRITLNKAAKTLTTKSGVEFGISHNLTLRVVSPWIIQGQLIGFIELGKEIDLITNEYTSLIKSDIVFTIKKDLITAKDFNKWKNKDFRNRYYHIMNNYYIIDSTIKTINPELQLLLNSKDILTNKYIENDHKKYFINSKKYFDITNSYVGNIFVLHDITHEYDSLYILIIKVSIIIFILLSLLFWYYTKYIRYTESTLNKAYKEIHEISIHDGLTKLYNKQYYLDTIPKFINKCSRYNLYISFILIDIDNFKKYNDNYGHLQGDEVLKDVANTIMKTFKRDNDYCFRVGGEEFLIVAGSEDPNNGLMMGKNLCKNIQELNIRHQYNNLGVVTVSGGVSTKKILHHIKIDKIYDEADKALYISKNNGRNQVTLYKKKGIQDEI